MKAITSFSLYRFRYWIGYGLIGLVLIGVLAYAGLYAPGGISNSEAASVIKSASIKPAEFSSYGVVNMPYHLLQKISIYSLGVSDFSIKLPSLILAFFSSIGLLILLRMWFKRNIALLGSVIALTTGQFLLIAQSGTPEILYIFWAVSILLLGMLVARKYKFKTLWKMLFFAIAAMSLYTPLSIYALLALLAASILHPHLRQILKSLSKVKLLISFFIGVVIISPLAYGIAVSPELGLSILGIPTNWPDWLANLHTLYRQYIDFASPSTTALMTPVFGLGSMLIIVTGAYSVIKTRESTLSYLIIIWLLCLIPIVLINPGYTSVVFLPLVLLLCAGLATLLGYWYGLFPHNPYARIIGLIPLVILVSSLVLSGISRYIDGYSHDPSTVINFSKDLSLIPKNTKHIVVAPSQLDFYSVIDKYDKHLTVSQSPSGGDSFLATSKAYSDYTGYHVTRIITSSLTHDSNRFYIYELNK